MEKIFGGSFLEEAKIGFLVSENEIRTYLKRAPEDLAEITRVQDSIAYEFANKDVESQVSRMADEYRLQISGATKLVSNQNYHFETIHSRIKKEIKVLKSRAKYNLKLTKNSDDPGSHSSKMQAAQAHLKADQLSCELAELKGKVSANSKAVQQALGEVISVVRTAWAQHITVDDTAVITAAVGGLNASSFGVMEQFSSPLLNRKRLPGSTGNNPLDGPSTAPAQPDPVPV